MDGSSVSLLGFRIFVSCVGLVGNVFLIFAIIQTKLSRVKSFELFLLGLATANLEEIVIVNIYDIMILERFSLGTWLCLSIKFLFVFGEIASIFFTVLISIFRYEKLRDASKRANLPVYLDSIRSAWMVSGGCVMLSTLLSLPVFLTDLQSPAENITRNSSNCPSNFFQGSEKFCPQTNCYYKYLFILMCNLLPLVIVTVTSCLTITVLVSQGKTVTPELGVSGSNHCDKKSKSPWLQRSTIDVLAAMGLFHVAWTLSLIFQLISNSLDFPFRTEIEFFISTSYTSISPYVYGIGGHLFSVKIFIKR
ncbi:hypothetical protein EXN66_Car018358 [Channa argus]|uniref:G-protein coupled receptors family 1 profile domain-containing protein n=1 Tax=Channa argus TaxID=215402 RepID=A0A6G1QIZ7_CHAAH|nr:hypothetical protein EXN66_Car018358 [Channa argus]